MLTSFMTDRIISIEKSLNGSIEAQMALSEVSYSFRICVNSVMSEVNIGVVSKMKTYQFVPLLPSHYAMTPPFTVMTSQVDCRSLVYEAGLTRLQLSSSLWYFSLSLLPLFSSIFFSKEFPSPHPPLPCFKPFSSSNELS